MVTISYPPAPSAPVPKSIREGIETGALQAERQEGVHRTYLVTDSENRYFYKDYTIRREPLAMLAERMAFAGARESAALFYREPLAWTRVEPGERAANEARALRQWQAIGIRTPRVLGYDDTGLVLEAIEGTTLKDKVHDGTLEDTHIERFVDALHTAREAALYIEDPSYLHNDPNLTNALASAEHVTLIDPGILTKELPVRELDAAFSLSYLIGLEGIARDARTAPREHKRIKEMTDAFADAYLERLAPTARERMLDYAHPVSERHIQRMRRIPIAPFQRFARWLSYSDAEALDRITTRIRTTP